MVKSYCINKSRSESSDTCINNWSSAINSVTPRNLIIHPMDRLIVSSNMSFLRNPIYLTSPPFSLVVQKTTDIEITARPILLLFLLLTYLLMSSYLLEHIAHALSTHLCFASSPSNDTSPSLYHLLVGQHRCILVCLVSSFHVLVPIAATFVLFHQFFSTRGQ